MASPAVAGAASLADFTGDVAIKVISPAVAGAASLADLAGDVAVAEASPAVAGAVSQADLAGVVTVGVAPLAIAGRRPRPLLGWHPWLALLGCHCRCSVPGRCWGDVPGRYGGGVPGRCVVRHCSVDDSVYHDSEVDN